MIQLAILGQIADFALSWALINRYGPTVEANPVPLMALAWSHCALLVVALKAALLALIFAAAVLNPRMRRLLLVLVVGAGFVGVGSGVVALLA